MSQRKQIFDAVRRMLKRGLRQGEVEELDGLIDQMSRAVDAPTIPERPEVPKRLGPKGKALIKRFEGCAQVRHDGLVEAYPDPGSGGHPWTIGWGSTGADHFSGKSIGPGTVWTQEQCDQRAEEDYLRYAREVLNALGPSIVRTSQEQFDALVSFHYNTGAIGRATLTRKHIADDHDGAAREFKRWNKASGRVLKGLVRRRHEEELLYRSGM